MGGYGSGKYQSDQAKQTVEDGITLSIFKLCQEGTIFWNSVIPRIGGLQAGKSCMWYCLHNDMLTLRYTFSSGPHAGRSVDCSIRISATHPNYGGQRLWWHCPECDRRCGKLYLAPAELHYLCRQCAQLTYQSTREMNRAKLWRYLQSTEKWIERTEQRVRLAQQRSSRVRQNFQSGGIPS
jgi:hypothetical protein